MLMGKWEMSRTLWQQGEARTFNLLKCMIYGLLCNYIYRRNIPLQIDYNTQKMAGTTAPWRTEGSILSGARRSYLQVGLYLCLASYL